MGIFGWGFHRWACLVLLDGPPRHMSGPGNHMGRGGGGDMGCCGGGRGGGSNGGSGGGDNNGGGSGGNGAP